MHRLNAWAAEPPTLPVAFVAAACAQVRTLLVASALALPFAAQAQQPAPAPQVSAATDTDTAAAQPPAAAVAPAAQPQQPAPITMPAAASPSAGNLLQTILALVFVLAILAGLAWFMKRYGPRAGGGSANLRVVGALSLGGRERIMVVEVGDQWIVVGASPGRINALATMPKQEGVEPSAVLAAHLPPATGFADWLKQTIDKRNAK
jgi:flagellar protein FliO/FliZ